VVQICNKMTLLLQIMVPLWGVLRAMIAAGSGREYLVMPHLQNAPHIPIHDRRIRTSLLAVWDHRNRWATPLYTCTQEPRRCANGPPAGRARWPHHLLPEAGFWERCDAPELG
jgi:hypothetical protein